MNSYDPFLEPSTDSRTDGEDPNSRFRSTFKAQLV